MIKVQRQELLNKLNILEKAYNAKNHIEALSYLKFDNGKLTMSNGYTIIITRIGIENDTDFKTLIPFKLLKDIVSKLDGNILSLESDENIIKLKCNRSNYKLCKVDFNSYPNISINKLENVLKINSNEFKKAISSITFACSDEERKPILTGANFTLKDNELNIIATDSFKLAKVKVENADSGEFNFTISKTDLNNLIKLIPNDIELEIRYDEKNIVFQFDDVLYKTRLLEGCYPNVEKILNIFYSNKIKFNKNELIDCLNRVSIFKSEDKTNIAMLSCEEGKNDLLISSSEINQIGNAKELISCDNSISGKSLKIACNCDNLLEALNTFESEELNLNYNDSLKPFTITSDSEVNLLQLLLPIKVD